MMTPDVVGVTPLPDYCLETVFANGERRWFDMKPFLSYPAFAALVEQNIFMLAHAEHGTVVWTDEIDLSPDTLYMRGRPLSNHQADALMAETAGAWGTHTLDEVEAMLAEQRHHDWDRD